MNGVSRLINGERWNIGILGVPATSLAARSRTEPSVGNATVLQDESLMMINGCCFLGKDKTKVER